MALRVGQVQEQPTYYEKCNAPEMTVISGGYSTAVGCTGNTNFLDFTVASTGKINVEVVDIFGSDTSIDYTTIINVQARLRYLDANIPVDDTDYYVLNVFFDPAEEFIQIKILDADGNLATPDFDEHVLFVDVMVGASLTNIGTPYIGVQPPRSVIDNTVRVPFYVDLTTPATPVADISFVTVTQITDTQYSVATRYSGIPVFLDGLIDVDESSVVPSALTFTVPQSEAGGVEFQFSMDSVNADPSSTDFLGVYLYLVLCYSADVSDDVG